MIRFNLKTLTRFLLLFTTFCINGMEQPQTYNRLRIGFTSSGNRQTFFDTAQLNYPYNHEVIEGSESNCYTVWVIPGLTSEQIKKLIDDILESHEGLGALIDSCVSLI